MRWRCCAKPGVPCQRRRSSTMAPPTSRVASAPMIWSTCRPRTSPAYRSSSVGRRETSASNGASRCVGCCKNIVSRLPGSDRSPGRSPEAVGYHQSGVGRRMEGACRPPRRRTETPKPVSLDVQVHRNWWDKAHRSYFVWEFGKAPDLVVEIVSNQKGNDRAQARTVRGDGRPLLRDPRSAASGDGRRAAHLPVERGALRAAGVARVSRAAVGVDAVGRGVRGGSEQMLRTSKACCFRPAANSASVPIGSISAPNVWPHCCAARASIRNRSETAPVIARNSRGTKRGRGG